MYKKNDKEYNFRLAASKGDVDKMDSLLKEDKNFNINAIKENGSRKTALHQTVINQQREAFDLLLSQKDKKRLKLTKDKDGKTPYDYAIDIDNPYYKTKLIQTFKSIKQEKNKTKNIKNKKKKFDDFNLAPDDIYANDGDKILIQEEIMRKTANALIEKDIEIEQLTHSIKTLKIERLTHSIKTLKKENADLKHALDKYVELFKETKQKMIKMGKANKNLESTNKNIKNTLAQYVLSSNKVQQQTSSLKEGVNTKGYHLIEKDKKINELKVCQEQLENTIRELQDSLAIATDANNQNKKVMHSFVDTRVAHEKEQRQKINILQTRLDKKSQEIDKLNSSNKSLNQQLKNKKRETDSKIQSLNKQLEQANHGKKELKQKLKSTKTTNKNQVDTIQELHRKLNKANQNKGKSEKEKKQLDISKNDIQKQENEIKLLKKQLEQANHEKKELKQKLDDSLINNQRQASQISILQEKCEETEKQLSNESEAVAILMPEAAKVRNFTYASVNQEEFYSESMKKKTDVNAYDSNETSLPHDWTEWEYNDASCYTDENKKLKEENKRLKEKITNYNQSFLNDYGERNNDDRFSSGAGSIDDNGIIYVNNSNQQSNTLYNSERLKLLSNENKLTPLYNKKLWMTNRQQPVDPNDRSITRNGCNQINKYKKATSSNNDLSSGFFASHKNTPYLDNKNNPKSCQKSNSDAQCNLNNDHNNAHSAPKLG
ncbi:MAG: hypothetical protein GY782_04530 [Gammaproteobacteria bacterium]|nr:hypothetical protein [Gammaproteobacteria bacterium]